MHERFVENNRSNVLIFLTSMQVNQSALYIPTDICIDKINNYTNICYLPMQSPNKI